MYHIKDFLYKVSSQKLTRDEITFYFDIIERALKYPILDGYNSHCWYYMGKHMDNKTDADKCFLISQKINPYSHFFSDTNDAKRIVQMRGTPKIGQFSVCCF